MTRITNTIITGLATLALIIFLSGPASAATYGFETINNDFQDEQLSLDVIDLGSGQVGFNFSSAVTDGSVVTTIYFDFGSLGEFGTMTSVTESTGVDYSNGSSFYSPTPGNLPGGNTIAFTSDFGINPRNPTPKNGIGGLESLGTTWTLANGFSYGDIIAALDTGNMRVGMHVQSLPGGLSASVTTSATPIPGAVWLLGSGLAGLVGLRRRIAG